TDRQRNVQQAQPGGAGDRSGDLRRLCDRLRPRVRAGADAFHAAGRAGRRARRGRRARHADRAGRRVVSVLARRAARYRSGVPRVAPIAGPDPHQHFQVKRAELGRWLRRTLLLLLIVLTTIQAWYLCWVVYWRWHNPALTAFMSHAQERLAARNPPARLKQQWIAYGRISGNLKRAVVAAEDARFIEHEGVDWVAVEEEGGRYWEKGRAADGV